MSNRVMDEPWEIDPIEFVEGDWEIARAERPGMYIYRVYGVSTSEEVDAAQLIEWGMARVLQYEVLAPWEDSIHFPPDGRIMRRIYDKGTKANRCYVIADGDGFAYVNRYYLVLHGLAEGTDKFRRDVIAAKVAGASTDDTWEEDGICLVKKAGYTVTRSIIPGFYKVQRGTSTFNWNAARLTEDGLAVSVYDYKLQKLASCTTISASKLKSDLHDLWWSDNADTVRDLSQIAALWHELCCKIHSPHRDSLIQRNRAIAEANATLGGDGDDIEQAQDWDGRLSALQEETLALRTLAAQLETFRDDTVSELDQDNYRAHTDPAEVRVKDALQLAEQLRTTKDAISDGGDSAELDRLLPLSVINFSDRVAALPEVKQALELCKDNERAIAERAEANTSRSSATERTRQLRECTDQLEQIAESIRKTRLCADRTISRQDMLYYVSRRVCTSRRRHRAWRRDNIRLTSGAKVQRSFTDGYYDVYYDNGSLLTVSRDELIYMNLARAR